MIKISGRKCLYISLVFLLIVTTSLLGCRIYKQRAKITSPKQELIQRRTSSAKVFNNADGTRTALIYSSPIHYRDSRGKWRDVQTRIENLEVRNAPFRVKFGVTPGLKFTVGSTTVEFIPQLSAPAEGIVNENQITYPEVFKATDLRYTILPTRVKEEIILKDSSAAPIFVFEVNSNKAVPPLMDQTLDFGYFRTLPPFALDVEGRRGSVKAALRRMGEQNYLILSLDQEWRANAKYPIVVDPTLVIQPDPTSGKDAYLDQALPDTNFGTDTLLGVSANGYNSRGLIQFDVSSIPKGSMIVSATISLYTANALGGDVHARRVTSGWDENSVTWNSQPSFQEVVATQTTDAANVWKSWDVTALVKDWHAGRTTNLGIILLTEEDPTVASGGEFYSSDYTTDTTLRPKLEVTYTVEVVAPTSNVRSPQEGAFIKGLSYNITGTAKDNLSGTGIARVEVSTDGGSTWREATGTTSWSYLWSFPEDGRYRILSRATDLAGNAETPDAGILVTVDNTLPTVEMTSPPPNDTVSGVITISGTATDSNLKNFRVEYGSGSSPTTWNQWSDIRTTSISNGVLASGKSFRLVNGVYTFRVTATDKSGNAADARVTVNVGNRMVDTSVPHKNYAADPDTCALCHRSHTASSPYKTKRTVELGTLNLMLALQADSCYSCHDGMGSVYNTKNDFDASLSHHPIRDRHYLGEEGHYENCSDCHNPHGNKDLLGQYYARLLRVRNSQQSDTYRGNGFCGACHGSSTSGSGYKLGGDHVTDFTGLAAHDTRVGDPASGTRIRCSNCHAPHGSNFWRLNVAGEENLCYVCHNSSNLPNTLNNWDVQGQFGMTSYHDVTSATGGKVECSSCHSPHVVRAGMGGMLSDPDNTKSLWSGSATDFCLRCHDGNAPVFVINSSAVVPYTISFPSVSAPFFPGWDQSAYTLIPAGMSATNSCTTCHHPHGSGNARLAALNYDNSATYAEEKLCLFCHKTGGAPGAADIATLLGKAYKHPADTVSGIHSDTEDSSNLGTEDSRRHSECFDCHNPHVATNEAATPPANKGVNWGVGGVRADDTIANPSDNQYEICFKCHSDYTSRPLGQTDKRAEFDPANPAYHPVETLGKNVGINPVAFVSPWNETSLIYCTDCHNNEDRTGAQCPLGSANEHILKDPYTPTDTSLCFDCHTRSVYTTPGTEGSRWVKHNITTGHGYCADCHETHGNKQEHLINRGYVHFPDGGKIVTDARCAGAGCHTTGVWIRYYAAY